MSSFQSINNIVTNKGYIDRIKTPSISSSSSSSSSPGVLDLHGLHSELSTYLLKNYLSVYKVAPQSLLRVIGHWGEGRKR